MYHILKLLKPIAAVATMSGMLASHAISAEPCTSISLPHSVVRQISDARLFRQDWRKFQKQIVLLENAIQIRDEAVWREAAASMQRAMPDVTRYVPSYEGRICRAVDNYATEAELIVSNLESDETAFSWGAAAQVTHQVRSISDEIRSSLPKWWFLSSHRHGRKLHRTI